jgi:hypothetical protein
MESWKLVLMVLGAFISIIVLNSLITKERFQLPDVFNRFRSTPEPEQTTSAPVQTTSAPVQTTSAPVQTTPGSTGPTPKPTIPYRVTPSTISGVLLKSNAYSAGYQSGGVAQDPLKGTITWTSVDITSSTTSVGILVTDYIVMPNSSQAFQIKGSFSTDSTVPIKLNVPGYFINDTLDEVKNELFIPADKVKQNFLFNCYINDSRVQTLNFAFGYDEPAKAGVTKFKVFVGADITIIRIKGDPSPVVEKLYPPAPTQPGKYTIKSVYYKTLVPNPYGADAMFLCSHQDSKPNYQAYCTGNKPDKPSNQFILSPVFGTTNVYTIQNVGYMELSTGSFLSGAGSTIGGIEAPILWFSDKNDTCEWIANQVKKDENVYTFQNVKTKTYLAAWSYMLSPVNGKDPKASVAQWHLNLA